MVMDNTTKLGDGGQTQSGQNLQADSGQTSAAEKLTSSIEEGKQYGGADVKKLIENALSADGRVQKGRADKAEAEVTRLTGMANGLTTQFNTVSAQVADLMKTQNEAEVAKVGDDPAAISSLRARQANTAESLRMQGVVADYEAKNTKLTERETEINTRETSINIKLAATTAGVDERKLAEIVPDGNAERLVKAANILKLSGNVEVDPVTGQPKPAALTIKPASPVSAGGGGESGVRQIVDKAKKRAGVIP